MTEFPVRKVVKDITDYVPGKNPIDPGVVKLASNENPFGPSPKALAAITDEACRLQIYPDQKSILLREALGNRFGVSPKSIICGNGSDDIMQILGSTYLNPGDEVIIPEKTFSLYELITRIFDGKIVLADLKDSEVHLPNIASVISQKTKLIFIANPNNPTGTIFTQTEFDHFINALPPQVLVVVDEAYAEFAESGQYPDTVKAALQGKNVIVLRTFSKFYGLAGLRVGYGISRPEIIAPMFRTKMPFNVNRLAQAAALAALEDTDFLSQTYKNNVEGKKYLYAEFDKLGLTYKKSEANFIFVNVMCSADELFIKLMKQGIIIRPLTSFGFPEAIRVSIGSMNQNQVLIAALKEIFA